MTSSSPRGVLQLGDRITLMPIIHGSGDCAVEVRREMLSHDYDCLAVPLPASFREPVERAIEFLPSLSLVMQREADETETWNEDDESPSSGKQAVSYVPIDPCQPVIAGLRIALQERMARAFIDQETRQFEVYEAWLPDPYALKEVRLEKFAAALLPAIPQLPTGQPVDRVRMMAARLRDLERRHRSILCLCSLLDWPWIRDAYQQAEEPPEDEAVLEPEIFAIDPRKSLFVLGELPFVTALYERARAELEQDDNLSVDGVKELLLAARDRYEGDLGQIARRITPKLLSTCLQYVRNLTLMDRRLTPSLYTLVTAARQIAGDSFGIAVAETAGEYAYDQRLPYPTLAPGIDEGRLPNGDVVGMKNRLPGQAVSWRNCRLRPKPAMPRQQDWEMRWNPFYQCSWPPEDVAIEKFRTHLKDAAIALLGADLARTEKFSTSLKDGLDLRETLRNWHTGQLYVKVLPPSRGKLDSVVMLFDAPADPREYPWRVTWHAEHHDESTLALFATDFRGNMVGPGIGEAMYGGALFLFPPRGIPDVWRDRRLDFCDTLEERLLAAACLHARERHVAVLSAAIPGPGWRRLAKKYGKKLIHLPMSRFSGERLAQLRVFHVLNGTHIRSYASHFIRKS